MSAMPGVALLPATAALILGFALMAAGRGAAWLAAAQSLAVAAALAAAGPQPVLLAAAAVTLALGCFTARIAHRRTGLHTGRGPMAGATALAVLAVAASRPDLPLGLALGAAAPGLVMAAVRRDAAGQSLGLLTLGNAAILGASLTLPAALPLIAAGALLPAALPALPAFPPGRR